MVEQCTCGAKPPADARFCHRCGRPLFEETPRLEETSEPPELPSASASSWVAALAPTEINFANRIAVRSGLLAAIVASLLISLPMPAFLNLVWALLCLLGAGMLSVHFYVKRAGVVLAPKAGARLGWITGVFAFTFAVLSFTITMLLITRRGGLMEFYRQQFEMRGIPPEQLESALRILENPVALAATVVLSLIVMFVLFTAVPVAGGALGAKFFGVPRDRG